MSAPPSWLRVREVLGRLLELPPHERDTAARLLCGSDDALLGEVRSLLRAHDRPGGELDSMYERIREREPRGRDPMPVDRRAGEYRLMELIGEGGMGSVFRAVDPQGEEVAVKILREGSSPAIAQRFRVEQEGLRRLSHRSVCRIREDGVTEEGFPYFVMDLVEGRPIDAYLDDRRATVAERLGLLMEVCQTVAHAHAQGVLHRDLKPSNILIRVDGSHVLLDFGIAKLVEPRTLSEPSTLTRRSRVFTPPFASPGQIGGGAGSEQSDVFSLGVLGYVLTSGRVPNYSVRGTEFDLPGDRAGWLGLAALRGTTPESLARELGPRLERVLQAATAQEIDDRIDTVDDLVARLARWQQTNGRLRPRLLATSRALFGGLMRR